jgi:hypothetical protein
MAGAAFGDARGRSPEREPTGKRLVVNAKGDYPSENQQAKRLVVNAKGDNPSENQQAKRLVVKGEGKTPDFVARGRVLMNPPFATSSLEVGF